MVGTKANPIHRFCRGACAVAFSCAMVVLATSPVLAQDTAPPRATDRAGPPAPPPPDNLRRLGVPTPSPTPSQTPAESGAPESGAVRTVISLAAVLGLVLLAAFTLKRLARSHGGLLGAAGPGGRAPAGVLEVLGRYPLSRGQSLILLKLDRRVLLLSQAAGGRFGGASLNTLCEIDDPEEIASILVKVREEEGDSLARRFQSVLGLANTATADADGEVPTARRTTIHPSGDRVELWSDARSGAINPAQPPQARGYSPALADSAREVEEPASETGADALRRRLGALRRLSSGEDGGRP